MRFGAYIRVSQVRGREGERFLSPVLQRERCAQWAAAHGHELVDVREDLDVSGGRRDRPNLEELVAQIEAGELGGLVVAALDRFGRSLAHSIAMIDRIDRAGGKFVSVADGFDTSTPYGRLALNVLLSIGQFELERIREQWRGIVERNVKAGRHTGATPPFGYDRGGDGRLTPNAQAPLVREVFALAVDGVSIIETVRRLEHRDLGGQRATRGLVYAVLRNRCYLGEARSGTLSQPGAHPALVDELTWRRAQLASPGRPARHEDRALLAGLIRCQACRYVMAPSMRGGKRRYKCLGRSVNRDCPAPAFVTEAELVPYVERAFFDHLGNVIADSAGDTEELAELQRRRDEAQAALVDFRDDERVQRALGMAGYADGLEARAAAVNAADRALRGALARRPEGVPDAASLRLAWPDVDSATRGRMLAATFDAIVVRKHPSRSERLPIVERVRLLARGGLADFDVPRSKRDRAVQLPPFPWPDRPTGAWMLLG